jgi:hypothetical protein
MKTRMVESASMGSIRYLSLIGLVLLIGCFKAPAPDLGKLKCTNDQQCPAGYSCLAPNQVGGCCKPGTTCPAPSVPDASNAPLDTGNRDGIHPTDAPGIDQAAGEAGGTFDTAGAGGFGGDTTVATGGVGGLLATGGITGVGGTIGAGGTLGTGGITVATGGAGGSTKLDANLPDGPLDGSTIDAPGSCAADKDCPAQTPLCLGNKCAKCSADTDCVGRTGPACAPSGLCVACTANKYCTGVAGTCDTTTSQCVGCVTRSDCSGTCRTCTSGVCTSVKNQDDPGVCPGTCDAAGACKAKQGQTCLAGTDCAGGIPCADGYCCDKTCAGSCEACNLAGHLGTCTTLGANAQPHTGHPPCTATDATCAGSCQGSATCTYPTSACGSATCTSNSYQPTGTCGSGACSPGNVQNCTSLNKACVVASGCSGVCVPGAIQCSTGTGGIPQLCSSAGTWQNQTGCSAGTTCSNGSCACAKTTCAGACVDTNTDKNNCGTCGHACRYSASSCVAGKCTPVVLASGLSAPAQMAQDSLYVYWIDSGSDSIERTAKDGSMATAISVAGGGSLSGIAVASNVLEFGQNPPDIGYNGDIWYVVVSPTLGSQRPVGISIPYGYYQSIAASGSTLYFLVQSNDPNVASPSSILSAGVDMSSTTTLCGPGTGCGMTQPNEIAVDANNIYWTDTWNGPYGGRVAKMAAGGGAVTTLGSDNYPVHIAVYGNYVYYQASNNLMKVGTNGIAAAISIASTAGGGVAADASGVYWTDGTGSVYAMPAGSTTATTIASSQGAPDYIISDATTLYWTNNISGTVMAVAK